MSSPQPEQDGSELPSLADLLPRRTRPRSRARQPSLSREQIVRAAVELADAEGPEAISMRRIAAQLGVGAMTLYGYVADRDALLAHMINEVVAEMGKPGRPSGSWRADLELLAHRVRDVNLRHAWLPAELGTAPFLISPRLVDWAEFILTALDLPGIDIQTAAALLRAVNNYVVGTTLREATESRAAVTHDTAAYQAAVASLLQQIVASGRYPAMGRLALALAERRDLGADESFELGLNCLLDGIGALIAEAAAASPGRRPGT
jgi:AcrR family transcriptional regulator